MIRSKKNTILLILLIGTMLILLLNMIYNFKHENEIVNILILLLFILIVFMSFKIRDKNLFLRIFRVVLIIISLILINRSVFLYLVNWYAGPEKEIDKFIFPNSPNESLKNIYYADTNIILPPIKLVYEKKLSLGLNVAKLLPQM